MKDGQWHDAEAIRAIMTGYGVNKKMSEKELEKLFNLEIKKAGGRSYKFVSPGTSGVPDRIIIFPPGLVGFVEVKAPGKKPRPEQEHQIKKLINLGCKVFVLDNPKQIPGITQQIKRQEADNEICTP